MSKKIRPLGDNLLDLEVVLDSMIKQHQLQFGDVLALVNTFLEVHHPEAKEEYVSGGSPVFYYGPKEGLK
jgi:hypothetical protein